jgi:outer membrane lipoprotein-sorting protein
MYRRRRKLVFKIVGAAAAAVLFIVGLSWLIGSQQPSFAETVKALTEAKSITWTRTTYERFRSRDGKKTWLKSRTSKFAYLSPGYVRFTEYDDNGNEESVTTIDTTTGKFLVLDVKNKKTDAHLRLQFGPSPDGPFGNIANLLKTKPVEFVGQRQVDGRTANVFRFHREDPRVRHETFDIWIDAETKQYLGTCDHSSDVFDPETAPDRNNPPQKRFGTATIAGSMDHEINYNAKLDPSLFSLTPPADYQVVETPTPARVTEQQMIDWLGLLASVNDDTFIDEPRMPFSTPRIDRAFLRVSVADSKARKIAPPADQVEKADGEPSELDKKLVKDFHAYAKSRHYYPVGIHLPPEDFVNEESVPNTFRWLGKGVKLGTADRVICWYKLKGTGQLRAVYGDLKVKDVKPEELPLPVAK